MCVNPKLSATARKVLSDTTSLNDAKLVSSPSVVGEAKMAGTSSSCGISTYQWRVTEDMAHESAAYTHSHHQLSIVAGVIPLFLSCILRHVRLALLTQQQWMRCWSSLLDPLSADGCIHHNRQCM